VSTFSSTPFCPPLPLPCTAWGFPTEAEGEKTDVDVEVRGVERRGGGGVEVASEVGGVGGCGRAEVASKLRMLDINDVPSAAADAPVALALVAAVAGVLGVSVGVTGAAISGAVEMAIEEAAVVAMTQGVGATSKGRGPDARTRA